MEKDYEGCHQCEEFPCKLIDDFPVPVGKKVILRAVPDRKKLGSEKWVEEEENRYICPHCSAQLFRGAKRCGSCKELVEID
jgi:Zn finger protein HypA/HybF involved in hydrogenase expression